MTEALKHAQDAVLPHQQPTKVAEPSVRALDFPTPPVASQLASIVKGLLPFPLAVGRNQLNAPPEPASPERIAVIRLIGNDALRLRSRSAATRARHSHLRQRALGQGHFVRRGRREPNSQRNTFAIGQYHAFRALAALCFAHREAPFFAGKKVPSRKHSSQRNSPRWSSVPSNARHARNQTPCSSHWRKRRQQVEGLGYCLGSSRHGVPLRSTQRMPSTQARLSAAGRPRRRLPCGCGNKFAITAHCWSVSLMRVLNPSAGYRRKCLI